MKLIESEIENLGETTPGPGLPRFCFHGSAELLGKMEAAQRATWGISIVLIF